MHEFSLENPQLYFVHVKKLYVCIKYRLFIGVNISVGIFFKDFSVIHV